MLDLHRYEVVILVFKINIESKDIRDFTPKILFKNKNSLINYDIDKINVTRIQLTSLNNVLEDERHDMESTQYLDGFNLNTSRRNNHYIPNCCNSE